MSRTINVLVTYRFRGLWLARSWVRMCQLLRFVVGKQRAGGWARAGVRRVVKPQILNHRFAP